MSGKNSENYPGIVTDWKKVAQSGPTIDGRFIQENWLTEMAETYNSEVYTAKLWVDHSRYMSYGKVVALKSENGTCELTGKPVIILFAKISPSRSLQQLNQVWDEKRHFSIEPVEDFAKSGKTYLIGLGMTDEPASLATSEMHYKKITKREFTHCLPGEIVPDRDDFFNENNEDEDELKESFFNFFKLFRANKKEETMELNKENQEKFDQAIGVMQNVGDKMLKIAESFNKMPKQPGSENESPEAPESNEFEQQEETPAPEEQSDKFLESFQQLNEKFDSILDKLSQKISGTKFKENKGPEGEQVKIY